MFCEAFIAFLSMTCRKTVRFVTYDGNVDVDEEGFMTMMFELGKTYPPDYALGNEWSLKGQFMTWIDVMTEAPETKGEGYIKGASRSEKKKRK
jgi:hypothetical protein